MEFSNEEMVKSLTSLIDETLEEIEEIKKSKFAAAEISIGDSSSNLEGKPKNGSLEAKKKEDEEEKDEDKDDKKEEKDEKKDMDKAEDVEKKEEKDEDKKDEKKEKKEEKDEDKKDLKKSFAASESLLKTYVDEKMSSIEQKLAKMADAIAAIADAPAPRKGVPAGFVALQKSTDDIAPLSKTELANKLFELKKSGAKVDSADIFRVETGNQATAFEVANKYGLR